MLISPALASLRVSWNHRFTQSATTSARGTRCRCWFDEEVFELELELASSMFFVLNFSRRSDESPPTTALDFADGSDLILDAGGLTWVGPWILLLELLIILAKSWILFGEGTDFPIKRHRKKPTRPLLFEF